MAKLCIVEFLPCVCSLIIKSRPSVLLTNEYSAAQPSVFPARSICIPSRILLSVKVTSLTGQCGWSACNQSADCMLLQTEDDPSGYPHKITAGIFPSGPFVLWFVTSRVGAPSQDPQQDSHGLQCWTADETLINVITKCGISIKKSSVLIQQITSSAMSRFKDTQPLLLLECLAVA